MVDLLMRRSRFLAFLAFVALVTSGAAHALSDDAANMLALENQLEEKLRSVLTRVAGSDQVIVLVSADGQGQTETKREEAIMLPGVPIKKEEQAGFRTAKSSLSKLNIKKLVVTVILDASVSDSVKKTVGEVASNVLALNKNRGDELYLKQIDFNSAGFSWTSFIYPTNLYLLVLTIVGGFFLVTAAFFLRNPFQKLGEALKGIEWGGAAQANPQPGDASGEKQSDLPLLPPTATAQGIDETDRERSELPFSFIQERHLANLAFLLKDTAPSDIAVVVNYIGFEQGNALLDFFPQDKRIEIALCLGTVDINPEKTHALENSIREKLDYVVGGERKLAGLLEALDDETRGKIVARIEQKDPAAAAWLRQQVKDLESFLRELPGPALGVIYRSSNAAIFAQLLKSMPDDIREKVLAALSAGAADRLRQEIEFSRPLTSVRLKKEKQNLAALIRRLIKDGMVEATN